MPITQSRLAPDINEGVGVSDESAPASSPAIWQRFSSLGIIAVLVGALAFSLINILPNHAVERLVKLMDINAPPPTASAPAARRPSGVSSAEVASSRFTEPSGAFQDQMDVGRPQQDQSEVLPQSEQIFSVNFSPGSDVLKSENWNTLDGVVVLLRERPDMIVQIADLSQESSGELYDGERSRSRAALVERYLMASGVNRRRLHIQENTALDTSAESALSHVEDTAISNEILYINLETKGSQ